MEVKAQPKKKVVEAMAVIVVLTAFFALFSRSAEAGLLKAKIYMTQEKIPRKLSEKELIDFVKKHQTQRIDESKESKVKDRSWQANVLIAFNSPLGALEFDLVFYDIQKGVRVLVDRQNTLLSERAQKTYLQKINLKRPRYQPNRKMELAIEVNRAEVGRFKFTTAGE
ncbi:MAG: hypothetical protein JXA30_03520 [Deltaproteobacteria bacterium]|nr:hypothetical protein [Deltaproteobacteria bacterium]